MSDYDLSRDLEERGNKAAEDAAEQAIKDNSLIRVLIENTNPSSKRKKNAAIKTLRIISDKAPELLLEDFDFFYRMMANEDNILKWNAIDITANLACLDRKSKTDDETVLKEFISLLYHETMITAGHSIDNIWKFAGKKPEYLEKIIGGLMKVDGIERNPECRNILAGKTIDALSRLINHMEDRDPAIEFAERHLNNTRNSTKKKAEKLLKKFEN